MKESEAYPTGRTEGGGHAALARLGHVHLKVRELERAAEFYTRHLGLVVTERVQGYVFLSAGVAHHDLALQEIGAGASPSPPHAVGLYHLAFEVADRIALARAYRRLTRSGVPVAAVDHGISWALYFSDPDGNGIELYWDTRDVPGGQRMWSGRTRPLDPVRLQEGLGER